MLDKSSKPKSIEPGTAVVTVDVAASPSQAWDALTDPKIVRLWFGELSAALKANASVRLDFGDGDFFMIEDVACDPPRRLTYSWRFLGTGPRDSIVWDITPTPTGARVRVSDNEPSRTPRGVAEMIEGWTDFLGRLQLHVATGKTTRYDWRREFSSAVELPGSPEQNLALLTDPDKMNGWMPFRATDLKAGGVAVMHDGLAPQRLNITEVKRDKKTLLLLGLRADKWETATTCRVEIVPHAAGSMLVLSHAGWENIGNSDEYQMKQRRRFGDHWVDSMRRARKLVDASSMH